MSLALSILHIQILLLNQHVFINQIWWSYLMFYKPIGRTVILSTIVVGYQE